MFRTPLLPMALALLTVGCLDVSPASDRLDFDLTQSGIGENWEIGAADYPVGKENDVAVVGDRRALPASLGTAAALYQAGTPYNGNLFVYFRKFWDGFRPSTHVRVKIQLIYVSSYHADCTTGPGPTVFLKAGVSDLEPRTDPDNQGIYRFSLDKGTGSAGGVHVAFGDIRNGQTGCPVTGTFVARTTGVITQSYQFTTGADGSFWTYIGTQSTGQTRHEIYFVGMSITFEYI